MTVDLAPSRAATEPVAAPHGAAVILGAGGTA